MYLMKTLSFRSYQLSELLNLARQHADAIQQQQRLRSGPFSQDRDKCFTVSNDQSTCWCTDQCIVVGECIGNMNAENTSCGGSSLVGTDYDGFIIVAA